MLHSDIDMEIHAISSMPALNSGHIVTKLWQFGLEGELFRWETTNKSSFAEIEVAGLGFVSSISGSKVLFDTSIPV